MSRVLIDRQLSLAAGQSFKSLLDAPQGNPITPRVGYMVPGTGDTPIDCWSNVPHPAGALVAVNVAVNGFAVEVKNTGDVLCIVRVQLVDESGSP